MGQFSITEFDNSLSSNLRSIFFRNTSFSGNAVAAAIKFEEWFDRSGIPFFKEYTDHSFRHSLEVFRTSCEIISDEAHAVLSSEDIIILFLSCLAHDAGLHLTEDMFLALIDEENSKIAIPEFDKGAWPGIWSDFIAEARRFNEKKLIEIFGDTTPISEPSRDSLKITNRDRLLIGEFIRRHHPRLAHEISIGAIPKASAGKLNPLGNIEKPYADLVGLIARSHGMPLRSAFQYISDNYDIRDFRRIHLIFLMVVLRIADYLQIQSARAPKYFETIHRIKSPFSTNEWRVHQSISNITPTSSDPEAIHVSAQPDSVKAFLRLDQWLNDLQVELDTSWAVLGEVYGRFVKENLPSLKIGLRRIRSNLDDHETFKRKVGYVPEKVRFTVDEPELLKLLLAPLYGDDPLFGLRELTQNAADAVREYDYLIANGVSPTDKRALKTCDIEIEIDLPNARFTISDRGAGMSLEVIKNYFLKAGASFRNSDSWKKDFADESGKSKVVRAGHFGVGALSAFLIGESVSVYTKQYSENSEFGYRFACSIDSDAIEVTREIGPVGTVIKIEAPRARLEAIRDYIRYIWALPTFYYQPKHHVLCFKIIEDDGRVEIIKVDSSLDKHSWLDVYGTGYESVRRRPLVGHWFTFQTPSGSRNQRADGYLFCNDLLVGDIDSPDFDKIFHRYDSYDGLFGLREPSVSIIDRNGDLPLNLSRKEFSQRDPALIHALKKSMAEEFVAKAYCSEAESAAELFEEVLTERDHHVLWGWSQYLYGKRGYALFDVSAFRHIESFRVLVSHAGSAVTDDSLGLLTDKDVLAVRRVPFSTSNKRDTIDYLRTAEMHWIGARSWWTKQPISARDNWISYHLVDASLAASSLKVKSVPRYVEEMIKNGPSVRIKGIKYLAFGDEAFPEKIRDHLRKYTTRLVEFGASSEDRRVTSIWMLREKSTDLGPDSMLAEVWKASFDAPFLPYKRAKRRSLLKKNAPIARYL